MFCPGCGKDVGMAKRFCRFCGGSLSPSPATPAGSARGFSAAVDSAAAGSELEGVWGWLLFFCLIQTVLAPAWAIEFRSNAGLLVDLLVWVRVLFGVFVAICLWSRSGYALKLLRIYFSVAIGVALLCMIMSVVVAVTDPYVGQTEDMEGFVFQLIGYLLSLATLGLWVGYFHTSKRVKATYGSNL
jgi:hypothetical protein